MNAARDPHPAWWVEHRKINTELDTWSYAHPDDPSDDSSAWQALYERSNELERLLYATNITTFEGASVVFEVLRHELEDSAENRVKEGLHRLVCFLISMDSALRSHDLLESVEFWFWRHQVPEASTWDGHPRRPVGLKFWKEDREAEAAARDLPASAWQEFVEAEDALDTGGEEGLPDDDPRLARFFAAQKAIVEARPTDIQGVAVQIQYHRWYSKDSIPTEAGEEMFTHATEQLARLMRETAGAQRQAA